MHSLRKFLSETHIMFELKWQNNVYCPSITHKDVYFAKTALELDEI
jgi:hypothetical protein